MLPPRRDDMHKGNRGKLLVAGGSINYPGAPALTALAALRCGGGVVTLLSSLDVCHACAARLPEVVHLPAAGDWTSAACAALPSVDALVLGPGLGRSEAAAAFVRDEYQKWADIIQLAGVSAG